MCAVCFRCKACGLRAAFMSRMSDDGSGLQLRPDTIISAHLAKRMTLYTRNATMAAATAHAFMLGMLENERAAC